MKFCIEPRPRFDRWIARAMDDYKIVNQSFGSYREAKIFLLKFAIHRMKIKIREYEKILEKM